MSALLVWLNAQSVIDSVPKLLLAPEISFCSLDGDMPQEELDLIQFATGKVAQAGAGATKVMRSEFLDTGACGSLSNNPPNDFRRHSIAPDPSDSVD